LIPKSKLVRLRVCASTNDEAKALARAGAPEGTAVAAGEQTSGRGTKGRFWHSSSGRGLYLSVVLRPTADMVPFLPLAAGVAARDAVAAVYGVESSLLWPNDLIWKERKLGGILCESAFEGQKLQFAVVGVGINVAHAESDFPPALAGLAVSVRIASGRPAVPEVLLAPLLEALATNYEALRAGGAPRIIETFNRHSVVPLGGALAVRTNEEFVAGTFCGLGSDGALILQTSAGLRRFHSAEVGRVHWLFPGGHGPATGV
jgi:BirA family biotin operon repressor/biotin-[acetyl-CoA-carboxylase] ligase